MGDSTRSALRLGMFVMPIHDAAKSLICLLVEPLHGAAIADVNLAKRNVPASTFDLLDKASPVVGAEAGDE